MGIKQIQQCSWKKFEKELYSSVIYNAERILYENGADMVGMSSLGPGLFFLADNIEATITKARAIMSDWQFVSTIVNNSGREIIIKDA